MADRSLPWFPVYRAAWLQSVAVSAMLPEQEGAYFRLLVTAWGKGDTEPSLPASDEELAILSKLGPRWKKYGGPVRAMFTERDGRLYNATLSEVWLEQCVKHDKAIAKARNAALARGSKTNPKQPPSNASSAASSSAPSIQILEKPLPLQGKKASAPDTALSPEGDAPPVENDYDRRMEELARESRRGTLAGPVALGNLIAGVANGR